MEDVGSPARRQLERAAERIAAAERIFVLTGAGISAESGLPTFRGVGGLWRTHRVEELASPVGFERDPELVWDWYNERRAAHAAALPNPGHVALARIEASCPVFTLATQNVDSLHLRAGSRNVLELHGNLREARCTACGARRPLAGPLLPEEIRHGCGGRFRPDIVWFGEPLPPDVWERALGASARPDVVIVVGTSGAVEPAASLATRAPRRDAFVIEVNPEATTISSRSSVALRGPAARILPLLAETAARARVSCGPT
jgi:NAD-dependent deacetylase